MIVGTSISPRGKFHGPQNRRKSWSAPLIPGRNPSYIAARRLARTSAVVRMGRSEGVTRRIKPACAIPGAHLIKFLSDQKKEAQAGFDLPTRVKTSRCNANMRMQQWQSEIGPP